MIKLVFALFMSLAVSCMADWIEPYGIDCGNTLYGGIFVSTSGLVNVRDFYQNPPAADSDSFKTLVGGLVISTNALVGGTSTFADSTYFSLSKYGTNVGVSFECPFDTNCPVGTLAITGVDARGYTQSETVAIVGTTVTYSNIPFCRITSAVLSVTSWRGTDRGIFGAGGTVTGYNDLSKIYPRIGNGSKLGLANIPASATAISASVDDTGKLPSYATIDAYYGSVLFGDVPNGSHEYEVSYRARGAK